MSDQRAWLARLADFEAGLKETGETAFVGLRHGTMLAELYRPVGEDLQTPHKRDEIYIVRNGTSTFLRDGERVSVAAGDVIFVPARMKHRFIDFSDDFDTWVLFWGPEGGET